jgi:hypothetical protein
MTMSNEKQNTTPEGQASEPEQKSRRQFVKTSAQVAVTAPAVAVLLSGMSHSAHAQISNYGASASHILDDFTFGNNEEDVDAKSGRNSPANYNDYDHAPQQDDHV